MELPRGRAGPAPDQAPRPAPRPAPSPVLSSVARPVPGPARRVAAGLRRAAAGWRALLRFARVAGGVAPRLCPVCGHRGRFAAFGDPPRLDALCPGCGALERHRLMALWIERARPFGPGHRVLHVAPEAPLAPLIGARAGRYETLDLAPRRPVTHRLDLCDTGLPAESYDRIVCNHVLEHLDDARALREMSRLLKPGGLAVISTPVIEGWAATHEDPAVTDPAERRLVFGQADHRRLYGRDLRDRIRAAGFGLDEVVAVEPDVRRHGLIRGETLFLCLKT
jgi:SAM-dependent methyltransferase